MANVFLSYDHDDIALAKPIALALEKAGHSVWYDRHIHGGAQYSHKIEQALDAADAVIVLWSPRSLESAWVRDEAAEGRDRGKLVPLSIDGVSPPMGFRQYQTIDLGKWKGRGKAPNMVELLEAIDSQAGGQASTRAVAPPPPAATAHAHKSRAALILSALLLAIVGVGWWWQADRRDLPLVEVAAANSSAPSQAAASDLYVKLGSLAEVGKGKWQLVDQAAGGRPDLIFRTAELSSPGDPRANLVLLDGKRDVLLWSREFSAPSGTLADLRQQLSLTAGRVLGCALESRETGGLRPDLLKLFLNACALMAEASSREEPGRIVSIMRSIVRANSAFSPAWSRLLTADIAVFDLSGFGQGDRRGATLVLKEDIARARRVAPDLPEIRLAEHVLLPPTAYGPALDLLSTAAAQAPDSAEVQAAQSSALLRVGRMAEGVRAARRASELDPLSPGLETQHILSMAYAGQLDEASKELARAERLWAGTGALRDALWGFHLRFGDPQTARRYAPTGTGQAHDVFLDARQHRTPEAIGRLFADIGRARPNVDRSATYGGALQAFGEFGAIDEAFQLIASTPTETVAEASYLLFRAPLAKLRQDARFIGVARRIGLTEYWLKSGHWPDYCKEAGLAYDCKSEAVKHAR